MEKLKTAEHKANDNIIICVSIMLPCFSFLHTNMGGMWGSQLLWNEEVLLAQLPLGPAAKLVIAENAGL